MDIKFTQPVELVEARGEGRIPAPIDPGHAVEFADLAPRENSPIVGQSLNPQPGSRRFRNRPLATPGQDVVPIVLADTHLVARRSRSHQFTAGVQ
jgi:hypothetical protein